MVLPPSALVQTSVHGFEPMNVELSFKLKSHMQKESSRIVVLELDDSAINSRLGLYPSAILMLEIGEPELLAQFSPNQRFNITINEAER